MPNDPEFDLRQSVAVLGRNWLRVALFVLSAMGTSLALTYVLSERYQATTVIMYRPNTDVQLESPSQQGRTFGFPVSAVSPFETLGLTIKQVGTSERILRPVVRDLGLDQPETKRPRDSDPSLYEAKEALREWGKKGWQVLKFGRAIDEDPTEVAIRDLATDTVIDNKQKNYLSTLTVTDRNPARAARIADRIGAELIRFLREQSVQDAHERGLELDRQLLEKRSEIDRTRGQIQAFKTSQEFISLAEETSLHLKSAEELTLKLALNESDLSAARARFDALAGQRATLVERAKAPAYNHLRQLEATLESDELKVRTEVAGLEAAHATLQANLDRARQRISKPDVEARHADLNLQLAVLEADYKKLSTLREEVRASELTSRAEVFALHPATPQTQPVRPIKVYHVLLSGVLALALGVGFTYLADYLRTLTAPKPGGLAVGEPHALAGRRFGGPQGDDSNREPVHVRPEIR